MMNKPEEYKSPLLDQLLAEVTPQEREKVWIKMRIAARIEDLRKERKLQKKALAEACGHKGSSMVTKWLSGGHNFTIDTLVDIGFALGVTVADLARPVENRVVFNRTITIHVSVGAGSRPVIMGDTLLAGRSSAVGTTKMLSEPIYHYGQQQTCLA